MPARIFRGWWIVAGCFVVAVLAWSFGLFGASVYLHAIHQRTGLSVGLISSAITLCYLLAACSQILVGTAIDRHGPAPVLSFGAVAMAIAVAAMGQVSEAWHVHAAFVGLGLGWACLSTTALTTTLAPWFERHQGRAMSTAMMGASVGGMVGVPALMFGTAHLGMPATMQAAALAVLVVVLPIAVLLLRRRPEELGLLPDGASRHAGSGGASGAAANGGAGRGAVERRAARHGATRQGATARDVTTGTAPRRWTRSAALRTAALSTVMLAFGLGLCVQIGFLTHHVPLLLPALGAAGASAIVTATAVAAFVGRLLLARFSDRVDVRRAAVAVLWLAAAALGSLALFPSPAGLIAASIVYGLTVGNVTTLAPIIVRREFGAASFGVVYGTAATGIQLVSALGPGAFGLLYDRFGHYGPALAIAAAIDAMAGALVWFGARRAIPSPQ